MHILIHGQETYLSLARAKDVALQKKGDSDIEIITLDADSSDPKEIITHLSSNNLFQEKAIYILKRLYRNKEKEGIIEELIKNADKRISDFIVWEDQKINKTTKYFKFFGKNIELFEKGDKREVSSWASKRLEQIGIQHTPSALKELVSRCNYDAERVAHVIEKLDLSEENVLTDKLIDELVSNTLEIYAWDLTDALNRRDSQNAVTIFENLLNQQIDPNLVLAMLGNNMKNIAQVHLLQKQGATSAEIAKLAGIHPFIVSKIGSIARDMKWSDIQTIFKKLVSLDLTSKKGDIDLSLGITILLSRI